MSYVYRKSEAQLWTVGFFDPGANWNTESDHDSPEKAAARVHYLNGGALATELPDPPDPPAPKKKSKR